MPKYLFTDVKEFFRVFHVNKDDCLLTAYLGLRIDIVNNKINRVRICNCQDRHKSGLDMAWFLISSNWLCYRLVYSRYYRRLYRHKDIGIDIEDAGFIQ